MKFLMTKDNYMLKECPEFLVWLQLRGRRESGGAERRTCNAADHRVLRVPSARAWSVRSGPVTLQHVLQKRLSNLMKEVYSTVHECVFVTFLVPLMLHDLKWNSEKCHVCAVKNLPWWLLNRPHGAGWNWAVESFTARGLARTQAKGVSDYKQLHLVSYLVATIVA